MDGTDNDIITDLTLRDLRSINYTIKTKEIQELEHKVTYWLSTTACGAIVYGRARIGKTRAMQKIADDLRERYGDEFPVIRWDITDHTINEKNFYTSLLMAMGIVNIPDRKTALALKEQALNELAMAAYKTPLKQVVLMLDEAWKLSEKDFSWLMDLYNILSRKDILLTCFLFGTRELKDFKSELKNSGKDQIIGRFMVNEFQFYGMKEQKELMLCLFDLDNKKVSTTDGGEDILVSDYFFPNRGDWKFIKLTELYWRAFMTLRAEYGIVADDIPMKYFIDSFILLLQKYGKNSENPIAFPTYDEILECIRESGYGESDDEYENSRERTTKRSRRSNHRRY